MEGASRRNQALVPVTDCMEEWEPTCGAGISLYVCEEGAGQSHNQRLQSGSLIPRQESRKGVGSRMWHSQVRCLGTRKSGGSQTMSQ